MVALIVNPRMSVILHQLARLGNFQHQQQQPRIEIQIHA
jgi:hypothetical protein